MGRKRNPVLPVFTRDILSSPRCRALSEAAAGIYFFLLCRLNEPPTPGAYRLSDWELHPQWKRSKTQQCLATADKQERLQYFAALLAKNDLPWKQKNILAGLQELYKYGIITVEADMLVQPRMYKDNGFTLPDLDGDGDPEGTIMDDPASGSMAAKESGEFAENNGAKNGTQKRTEKVQKKVQKNALVSHAPAHSKELGDRDNNKGNSIGNIGGVGETSKDQPKQTDAVETQSGTRFVPPTLDDVTAYCQEKGYTFDPIQFWNHYEANGWVQGRNKPIKKWQACCVTWQQRENNGEFKNYRHNETATRHQYHPQSQGDRDRDILEQSARIVERKLRRQEQEHSGSEAGDTE